MNNFASTLWHWLSVALGAITELFDSLDAILFSFFAPLRQVVIYWVNVGGENPHPLLSQLAGWLTDNVFGDVSLFALFMLNALEIYIAITLVRLIRD